MTFIAFMFSILLQAEIPYREFPKPKNTYKLKPIVHWLWYDLPKFIYGAKAQLFLATEKYSTVDIHSYSYEPPLTKMYFSLKVEIA